VGAVDLRSRPITREGELLETVPGMIVTQHSGEGKANQYFVRGFNLDHGTDFQTRVEGMPVNMPTHGHGQGWTDLNFLVPELVSHLDYRLGVYHAELGDFGSAGGAEFHLVRTLERPFVTLGAGQNGLARAAAGASTRTLGGDLLAGAKCAATTAPGTARRGSASWPRWRATRRIAARRASRCWRWRTATAGTPTTRCRCARSTAAPSAGWGRWTPPTAGAPSATACPARGAAPARATADEVQLFGIYSDLDLYSNFTYFLDDPERGDQFNQKDRRVVLGANAKHTRGTRALGTEHRLTLGAQTRADLIGGLGLYRTQAQLRHATVREDRVRETGTGLFAEAESRWRPWLRSIVGVRGDGYTFHVDSDRPENSGDRRAGIVSPKASLVIAPSTAAELYLSGGFGFHSNDARGTTITIDPATGERADRVDPLVRSRGAEAGLRMAPVRGLRSTLTVWALELDSELLFVGDAGATEPSATSRRSGVTWANFYRPIPALSLDADVSFARARLAGVPAEESRIPGALEHVFAGGIAWAPERGPFGALRVRHFGAYPLLEDNSVRADAATLVNAEAGWHLARGLRLEATILNLLNSRAADIQYYYPSRLRGEPAGGVSDIHFHPVEPRQLRASLTWSP
jgi:hypothetical protein